MSNGFYNLTYRGVNYRVDPNDLQTEAPVLPTTYKLTHRGMTYLVTRTATGKVTVATQCTSNVNVVAFSFPH
jgi:hypothetical protein